MKVLALALICSLIGIQWFRLVHDQARFSLELPDTPEYHLDSVDSEFGSVKIQSYTSAIADKIYIANLTTYPKEIDLFDQTDSLSEYLISAIKDQMIYQLEEASLTHAYKLQCDGIPSEVFQITYGRDSSLLKMCVIPFYNHLLTLQYFCNFQDRNDREADRFFSSFKYLHKKQ